VFTPNWSILPLAVSILGGMDTTLGPILGALATEARNSKDFLIIARTDARTAHGLDEALRRGETFARAGADILFIESPESVEEMETIARNFDMPLLANMVEGGRTPILSGQELESLGFRIAIFPVAGFLAAGAAMASVYGHMRQTGSSKAWQGELYPFDAFSRLMGFERIWAFERAHADLEEPSSTGQLKPFSQDKPFRIKEHFGFVRVGIVRNLVERIVAIHGEIETECCGTSFGSDYLRDHFQAPSELRGKLAEIAVKCPVHRTLGSRITTVVGLEM
jgi:hypothetical protein